MKVVLLQLPFLYVLLQSRRATNTNVPIAAGYLKAAAKRDGLLDGMDIEIFDTNVIDTLGDALLLDRVLARQPDIVGFSIYEWNACQSFELMARLREHLPNVTLMAGGPEFVPDSHHFKDVAALDMAVFGDGEDIFCDVLREHQKPVADRDWSGITGICYRDSAGVIQDNGKRVQQVDYRSLESPYTLRYIDTSLSGSMVMETERGCMFKCSYCNWSGTEKNLFPLPRIREEIQQAVDDELGVISVVDPTFNLSRQFRETCELMIELDPERKISKFANILAEGLRPEDCELMARAGFTHVTVGLQSGTREALKYIRRITNLKKLDQGVHFLLDAGITPYIDIILGLPGDTLETTKETVRWIEDHGLAHLSRYNILTVNPDTHLWRRKEEVGLKTQQGPPYRILSTPWMTYDELLEAIAYCDEHLEYGQCYGHFEEPSLADHFTLPSATPTGESVASGSATTSATADIEPLTKVVVDVPADWSVDAAQTMGENLARGLGSHPYIWMRGESLSHEVPALQAFLSALSQPNPYLIWKLILESEQPITATDVDAIEAGIIFLPNNVDYDCIYRGRPDKLEYVRTATKTFVVLPASVTANATDAIDSFYAENRAPVFARIVFSPDTDALELVDEALARTVNGLLIDFTDDTDAALVCESVRTLTNKCGGYGRNILFKNGLLQQAFDWRLGVRPFERPECFVHLPATGHQTPPVQFHRELGRVPVGRWVEHLLHHEGVSTAP